MKVLLADEILTEKSTSSDELSNSTLCLYARDLAVNAINHKIGENERKRVQITA